MNNDLALATPYMIVDGSVVRRNLERLSAYAGEHYLSVRPHTKTHKSVHVGRMQIEAGALGLTVAKVGEAEVMSKAGEDILVAYPAVDPARTSRLARLALHKTIRVAVDSIAAAKALADAARSQAATLGILVDVDVGFHRTGVQTPAQAVALALYVDSAAGLRLDGIFCFPGHIAGPAEDQEQPLAEVSDILAAALDEWAEHGLEAGIISGGSSPTAFGSHLVPELTEIRPGTYVYNDMNMVHWGYCTLEDCAARVISTVVSDAVPGQVILDAGSKTLTSERCAPQPDRGFGYLVEYPEAIITRLTEEHGHVDTRALKYRPQVGEQVTVIPNHICPCVNMFDQAWWKEADGELRKLPIDARGKLS